MKTNQSQPLNQILSWREHKNRQTINRIAMFFESLAVIIVFVGIALTVLNIMA
jgi:hypothetical protein